MKRILLCAALICIVLTVSFAVTRIRTVAVTGNERYTDEEIIDLALPGKLAYYAAYTYLNDRFGRHAQIPFVQSYSLVFHSPVSLEIIVYEKSMVGYVTYMGNCLYFDKDGIVVESSPTKLPGIPEVNGLKFGHVALYQELPIEDAKLFGDIQNLTQLLALHEIATDRIYYDSLGECTLTIGALTVRLGGNDSISGKIVELKGILQEIAGLSGTLYLEDYDENNPTKVFTFKRNGG
ncbi:MAG: cell division protein FtsQ [Lachnospiraceae bacterium]|jgi:cell division protein FtsQ|nr:cell division protein FtsQ [Lachnospiraceae bacterium]